MTCEEYARMKKNKRCREKYYLNHEENKAKSRERQRKYREKHLEAEKDRQKAYYERHKSEISLRRKDYMHEYWLKNKERIMEQRRLKKQNEKDNSNIAAVTAAADNGNG